MKIYTRRWFIFNNWIDDNKLWILDLSNEDVNDTEIAMCIDKQIYSKKKRLKK